MVSNWALPFMIGGACLGILAGFAGSHVLQAMFGSMGIAIGAIFLWAFVGAGLFARNSDRIVAAIRGDRR